MKKQRNIRAIWALFVLALFSLPPGVYAKDQHQAAKDLNEALKAYCLNDLSRGKDEPLIDFETMQRVLKIKRLALDWFDEIFLEYKGTLDLTGLAKFLKNSSADIQQYPQGSPELKNWQFYYCFEPSVVLVSKTKPSLVLAAFTLDVGCSQDTFYIIYAKDGPGLKRVYADPIEPYETRSLNHKTVYSIRNASEGKTAAFLQSGKDIYALVVSEMADCMGEYAFLNYQAYRLGPNKERMEALADIRSSWNYEVSITDPKYNAFSLKTKKDRIVLQVRSPMLSQRASPESSYPPRQIEFVLDEGVLQPGEVCDTCKPWPDEQSAPGK